MDTSQRVEADYWLETPDDPRRTAEAMAGEQSSGTFIAVPGETPELAAALRLKQTVSADAIEARIRRAMEQDELPTGINARAIADFYATVHRGLTMTVRGGASAEVLDSVVSSAMAAWEPLTGGPR